jgi:hypothetical protein
MVVNGGRHASCPLPAAAERRRYASIGLSDNNLTTVRAVFYGIQWYVQPVIDDISAL